MEGGKPAVHLDGPKKGKAKKAVITWCWARDHEGSASWQMTRPSDHLPLYGLDRLVADDARPVLLVEGCKKSDLAQNWLPDYAVMTWCGGSKNVKRADTHQWEVLKGRRVLLSPDFDKSGINAMRLVAGHLKDIGADVIGIVDLRGRYQLQQGADIGDCGDADIARVWISKVAEPTAEIFADMISAFPGDLDAGEQKTLAVEPPPPGEQPAETDGDDEDDIEASDIAHASRFIAMHGKNIRYCAEHERWYIWDGKRWAPDYNRTIISLAETTAKQIARELIAEGKDWIRQADEAKDKDVIKSMRGRASRCFSKSEQIQKLKNMEDFISLARSRQAVLVNPVDLDHDDYLLNCDNGIFNLRDGRLWKHDPKWLCTRMCPIQYDPAAASDAKLHKVLTHVCNDDPETVEYAQKIMGHSIFGHNRLEQFYLWWGPGGSGKGTLMEAVKTALGDYCLKAEFQSFIKTQGQRVRDDLDRLKEARLVLASEIDRGEAIAAAVLKEMTGGDTIASRQLYGEYREFRPRMTLHLQANDKPRIDDQDSGMWRRLVCIPCGPSIPDGKRDPDIKEYLQDPARGGRAVLAWLVAGAVATHKAKHIPLSPAVAQATAEYRLSQDPLRGFIESRLLLPPVDKREATVCTVGDLNDEYAHWCKAEMIPDKFRLSAHKLRDRLSTIGAYKPDSPRKFSMMLYRIWVGITLTKQDHELRDVSYRPNDEEHESALRLQGYRITATQQSPTRARADTSCGDLPKDLFSCNLVTSEKETKESKKSTEVKPERQPGDDEDIDLSEVIP